MFSSSILLIPHVSYLPCFFLRICSSESRYRIDFTPTRDRPRHEPSPLVSTNGLYSHCSHVSAPLQSFHIVQSGMSSILMMLRLSSLDHLQHPSSSPGSTIQIQFKTPKTMASNPPNPPPLSPAYPKSRLLRSIARHVSAPIDPSVRESEHHSSPTPKTSLLPPTSKHSLLSELSLAQSVASRLRRDRDTWRTLAAERAQDLESTYQSLQEQARMLSSILERSLKLQAECKATTKSTAKLYSQVTRFKTKHEKLIADLNDAKCTIVRLRRSDRSKDKVQQQNLRLKALLRICSLKGSTAVATSTHPVTDAETALREALGLALERIDDLEGSGSVLLDELEKHNDNGDDDAAESGTRLIEAQVVFRSILDDGFCKEQKESWGALVEKGD